MRRVDAPYALFRTHDNRFSNCAIELALRKCNYEYITIRTYEYLSIVAAERNICTAEIDLLTLFSRCEFVILSNNLE